MDEIIIYTDGGCSGNPGPGAWAYVMRYRDRLREDSGFSSETTNNRMELEAVIQALGFIHQRRRAVTAQSARPPSWVLSPIKIHTDSQYVKNGITDWIAGWKSRGWKTSARQPVKNQELWMRLDELVTELQPEFLWVEGHAGIPDNERCDSLVRATIQKNSQSSP